MRHRTQIARKRREVGSKDAKKETGANGGEEPCLDEGFRIDTSGNFEELMKAAVESVMERTPDAQDSLPAETDGEIESAVAEAGEDSGREAENAELKNRLLRIAAELDNYRKRAAREKEDMQKFAGEGVIKDFLSVADNMENALSHIDKTTDVATLRTGVQMTLKSFMDILKKKGVTPFDSIGQPFDPAVHEAVQTIPSENVPAGSVVSEVRRGYKMQGRLLRPALVVVSTGPAKGLQDGQAVEENGGKERKSDDEPSG
jgi:molecular chaperone GrpE